MKPLKFKGIPQKQEYEEMLLADQVKIGIAYEMLLKKAYHADVETHLNHLRELALNETRYHLVNLVEKTGEKKGLDYRESIMRFDLDFQKVHPKKLFFTQALIEDESFTNIVEVKKLVLAVIGKEKKVA